MKGLLEREAGRYKNSTVPRPRVKSGKGSASRVGNWKAYRENMDRIDFRVRR